MYMDTVKGLSNTQSAITPSPTHCAITIWYYHAGISCYRLQAEAEEVLEGRTEVTHEDLEKLQYTEQVIKKNTQKCLSMSYAGATDLQLQ